VKSLEFSDDEVESLAGGAAGGPGTGARTDFGVAPPEAAAAGASGVSTGESPGAEPTRAEALGSLAEAENPAPPAGPAGPGDTSTAAELSRSVDPEYRPW